jgi:large subunit ribosomal protein L13
MMTNPIYIDGTNLRFGRVASNVAKQLINGNYVVVVNVEKMIVSGSKASVMSKYSRWMGLRTYKNPEEVGPKHHRSPDRLLFYSIRDMLPKAPSGKEALKRLKVYLGVPDELKSVSLQKIEGADLKTLKGNYMVLEEVSRNLGWAVQ